VSSQLHIPATLPQGKSLWYPLGRKSGWGPRARLDMVVKRKIFLPCPCQESNPTHPSTASSLH